MKKEIIKKISNKYNIIKQVYDDSVIIRTNNVIYSAKYNAYMLILTNNSCIWINAFNAEEAKAGVDQWNTTDCFLVKLTSKNFEYIKKYDKDFENFNISKEDEITTYEEFVELAKEQEKQNYVVF